MPRFTTLLTLVCTAVVLLSVKNVTAFSNGSGQLFYIQGCTSANTHELNVRVSAPRGTTEVCWTREHIVSHRSEFGIESELVSSVQQSGCSRDRLENGDFHFTIRLVYGVITSLEVQALTARYPFTTASGREIFLVGGGPEYGCPGDCGGQQSDPIPTGTTYSFRLISEEHRRNIARRSGCSVAKGRPQFLHATILVLLFLMAWKTTKALRRAWQNRK